MWGRGDFVNRAIKPVNTMGGAGIFPASSRFPALPDMRY
jgi:hypothetical protein